ncbi:MAG TPA: ABC transporter permease [Blastocatellia bacterium]|nr:ABC transporter permease [Blastocatellia bacterium]
MSLLWQDLRYAVRMLRHQPLFTLVAVLTLSLGIGANSAIFSVVDAVLLRPLEFTDPDKIVRLWETLPGGGTGTVSPPNLKDWREQNDVFTQIAAYTTPNYNLQNYDSPEQVAGAAVTAEFFDVLGIAARLGRTFRAGEDQAGNHRVVVLSDSLWRRNFAADEQIVGKTIALNGENFTVIGVMPSGLHYPARLTKLWTPFVPTQNQLQNRGSHFLSVIARLKPNTTVAQAQQQMTIIGERLAQQYPNEQTGRGVLVLQLHETVVRNVRPTLLVLLGAVGFVLLIACVNVANLLLARAAARQREISIRLALGAGRWRMIRQFLTESLLLALLGGVGGLLLAKLGVSVLMAMAETVLPRAGEVGLDTRVVVFTILISLLTGVVFGLAPALQSLKVNLQTTLKEGGSAGEGRHNKVLRNLLVVAEVAAAFVLLIGAGLTLKSFVQLQRVETGLRPENVLTMSLTLAQSKYPTPPSRVPFFEQLTERVAALPGVEAAGVINLVPLQNWGWNSEFQIEGRTPFPPGISPYVEGRTVTPDYFRAMGIPLRQGRFLTAQDNAQAPPVILINQTFAQQYFAPQDPIGQRIKSGGDAWLTIVGVVGDVKNAGLAQGVRLEIYAPHAQHQMSNTMSLVVRAKGDPNALTAAIRREVQRLDPAQPIHNIKTMETVIAESVSDRKLNMILLGVFAGVAVLLAIIGIYSVMSYTVTQSTREIGIRMALGAQPRNVLKLVVGQGAMLAAIGISIGLAGAWGLTRLMTTLLFEVSATDMVTYVGVSLLLLTVALLACLIPARRATKVDPMIALRGE